MDSCQLRSSPNNCDSWSTSDALDMGSGAESGVGSLGYEAFGSRVSMSCGLGFLGFALS